MRIHVFQHVPFEGPANIAVWAASRGHSLSVTRLDLGERPPAPRAFDALVVLGGPMGVHDEFHHPWLADEKQALAAAMAQGRPTLGVCLGAQLMARVLGAQVEPNPVSEIGFHPVTISSHATSHHLLRDFPPRFMPLHWHGDTFGLPRHSVPLASSAACVNQAFLVGEDFLGLQFHLETTHESLEALIAHAGDDLTPTPSVQDAVTMRHLAAKQLPLLQTLCFTLLDRFFVEY